MRLMLVSLLLFGMLDSCAADLVVFSYDRPMQLYAFLESVESLVSGIGSTDAVVRLSANKYKQAYDVVAKKFPWVQLHYQQTSPNNFKQIVMKSAFKKNGSSNIIFAVDDIIVTREIDLAICSDLLKKHTNAYSVMLRLGLNINYEYMKNLSTPLPKYKNIDSSNCYLYRIGDSAGDWRYLNSVDMCVYRKKDIQAIFKKTRWSHPNNLELAWLLNSQKEDLDRRAIFFEHSKIVNIPINCVGAFKSNRNMKSWTPQELLEKFNSGYKIDIKPFYKIDNNGTHMEYKVSFISR